MKSIKEKPAQQLTLEGARFSMKYCRMALITERETRMGSIRSAAGTQSASALERGFGWCQGLQGEPLWTPLLLSEAMLEGITRACHPPWAGS